MLRRKRMAMGEAETQRVIKDPARSRDRTMNRAIRLLAARPRSFLELRERLLEKSWTNEEIVDAVLDKLKEYKYLDDRQFARDLAVSRLRQKPQGRRRLKQTLSQKKLDAEIVEEALISAYEIIPEAELIARAIEKRLRIKGVPQTRQETKKFYDYLLRQGFTFELVRQKLHDIVKAPRENQCD